MKNTLNKWQSEFWQLTGSGSGKRCPVGTDCDLYKVAHRCPYTVRGPILRAIELERSDPSLLPALSVSPANQCKMFILLDKLADFFLMRNHISTVPVPLELAYHADKNKPTDIQYLPLKALHGTLWDPDDKWLIQINSNDPVSVQRYTVFHEVFHILSHQYSSAVFHGMNIFNSSIIGNFNTRKGDFNEMPVSYTHLTLPTIYSV